MNFETGDIIRMRAVSASKPKYHLFVFASETEVYHFLFFNSHAGYDADLEVDPADADCLPPSKTGHSVISCSMLPRARRDQLKAFGAEKVGIMSTVGLEKLFAFISTTTALSRLERRQVAEALSVGIARRKALSVS